MVRPTPGRALTARLRPWRVSLAIAALLALLTGFLYAPTLDGGYQADDFCVAAACAHPGVGILLPNRAFAPFVERLPADATWGFHRPVWAASFLLEAGPLRGHPTASRLLSVALQAIAGAALVALLRRQGLALAPAALAAAAFALGPSSAQAVAWITSRCDLLATAFGLLALAARGAMIRSGSEERSRWRAASLVLLALALWSKESAYAFVPALVGLHATLAPAVPRPLVARVRASLDVVVLAAVLLAWRAFIVGDAVGGYVGGASWWNAVPWTEQLDRAGHTMFPATLLPGEPRYGAGALLCVVLALAALVRGRAAALAGAGLIVLVTSLALVNHTRTNGPADPESARLLQLPSAAWMLAVGAVVAGAWDAWRAWPVRVVLGATLAAVVVLAARETRPIVLGHAEAGELASEFVESLREVEREQPRGPVVLWGVPDVHGPGLVGRNVSTPFLVPLAFDRAPRFLDIVPTEPNGAPGAPPLQVLRVIAAGAIDVRRWDPELRRFAAGTGQAVATHLRGTLRRGSDTPLELTVGTSALPLASAEGVATPPEGAAVLAELLVEPSDRAGAPAVVSTWRSVPPTLGVRVADGAPHLVATAPPGAALWLLVGDDPAWTPAGALGTVLVAGPRWFELEPDENGVAVVPLATAVGAARAPRYVQALVQPPLGLGWLSEALELPTPGAAPAGGSSGDAH